MQVFKACYKVIFKNKAQLIVYIVLFMFFAIFLSNLGTSQTSGFTETKCLVAIFNEDSGAALADGLAGYLAEKTAVVDIADDAEKLQDALFMRDVEYVLRIPKGFSEGLIRGDDARIEKTAVPDSTSAVYIDMLVNKYINTYMLYEKNTGLGADEIVRRIGEDLKNDTPVEMGDYAKKLTTAENCVNYFNYLAYSLFAILILGLGAVILVFNKTDLKRRNLCSPMKLRSMNTQLLAACLSFAVLTWILLITTSFIMYSGFMLTAGGALMLANSFIFTISALSLSFLIANVIKSQNAEAAAANVLTLGTCFISGVYVPQELLGDNLLTIASFTPTYWYVRNNHLISGLVNISTDNLLPIFLNLLIVFGFAAAALAISLVVIKQRRVSA